MRYASVVPDISTRALDQAYDYLVPKELEDECQVGCTVLVGFARRPAIGYVIALSTEAPHDTDLAKIRPIERVLARSAFDETSAEFALWIAREYAAPLSDALRLLLPPGQTVRLKRDSEEDAWELVCEKAAPIDDRWVSLTEAGRNFKPAAHASRQRALLEALARGPVRMAELSAMSSGMSSVVKALEARGVVCIEHRRRIRGGMSSPTLSSAAANRPEHLTCGQKAALIAIDEARCTGAGDVVVVDGVTGSGKTEVYIEAIEHALEAGQGAIVLVPEISLTPQTVGRFRSRFGDDVAILHSRLSVGERYDQWDMVRQGLAHVVVGARSALFAPLHDVGLIVVDEEHEGSYKQGSSPRYHAREAACELARLRGCALVLGSATPSLESLARCQEGSWRGVRWTRVEMPERPGISVLPEVRIVDMTQQFSRGNHSIFSDPLREGLLRIAERKEKAVLLLNRRGFANFLMCRECGCVPTCPHCSTSLTFHERTHELVCHTCGRTWPIHSWRGRATRCPKCGSPYLAAFGLGTQRVEDELGVLLGDKADVIRMDADTTKTKGAHERLLAQFDDSPCAVLIGTQMIAKGLDFPQVTLVGVINADTTLKLPDFRAAERTYDLLEQVAGRAGRGERSGEVIVQTYWASHPAITSVAKHNRSCFLTAELADRAEAAYPPYARLANCVVWGRSASDVEHAAAELADSLRAEIEDEAGWEVIGPAECVKSRVKDNIRRHVVVKAPVDAEMGPLLVRCASKLGRQKGINMALDVDAYDLL